jgi:transposase
MRRRAFRSTILTRPSSASKTSTRCEQCGEKQPRRLKERDVDGMFTCPKCEEWNARVERAMQIARRRAADKNLQL